MTLVRIPPENIEVDIYPYVATTLGPSGMLAEFKSDAGTGASRPITINFGKDVKSFSISILGTTYAGSYVEVFDSLNRPLKRKSIPFDSNWSAQNSYAVVFDSSLDTGNIPFRYAKLVPAPNDYVAYANLQATAESIITVPGGTNPDPTTISGYVTLPVYINVLKLPEPSALRWPVEITVFPPVPNITSKTFNISNKLTIRPLQIRFEDAFTNAFNNIVSNKINTYYDQDRVLKTVVNLGENYQLLTTNWKLWEGDPELASIAVKLYQPLPREIRKKTQVWISREISPPLIDQVYGFFLRQDPNKIYLRPAYQSIKVSGLYGATVENVTETSLYSSGAFDIIQPTDPIYEEWFTTALEGAELNIDYSDYRNFVFYGSAEGRLDAFIQKLYLIEDFDRILSMNSASLAAITSGTFTQSLAYQAVYNIAEQRSDVIRSFDPYERYLYYNSGSAYSSSFNDDEHDEFHYHIDATWPKTGSVVMPVASCSTWIDDQRDIAQKYDEWNNNALHNNIPEYLYYDNTSDAFITFIKLIGHIFDVVKPYADGMSLIYDRHDSPTEGLSQDLVWNIARSFGADVPTQYGIKELLDFAIGESGTEKIFRNLSSETYKRFLSNHIYMLKSRGTKEGLRALLNAYGILPSVIQIRESSTPTQLIATQSFEAFTENTFAVDIDSGDYIQFPWNSTSLTRKTIQMRFRPVATAAEQTLLQFGTTWGMTLEYISSSYGILKLKSGATTTLSSSVYPFFDGTYYSVILEDNASGTKMYVKQASEADLVYNGTFQETGPVYVSSSWSTPDSGTIGAPDSTFGTPFDGYVDEFRVWGIVLSESIHNDWVKYPATYFGNDENDAKNNLWIRLSFNTIKNLGSSSVADRFVVNESPYVRPISSPIALTHLSASGFADETSYPYSFNVESREVVRYNNYAGGSIYDNNKVIIAAPPVHKYSSGSNVPVLSHNQSMVSIKKKEDEYKKSGNQVGFFFSPTDTINDSIIRAIGNVNIHDKIGDPADITRDRYSDLETLNSAFWTTYAYTVNKNYYIDIVKNLLGPLFDQAPKQSPARAKVLTGIVIEPHILERSKVKFTAPEATAGQYTRNNTETHNLEAEPVYTSPTETTGDDLAHDAIFDVESPPSPTGSLFGYEVIVDNDLPDDVLASRHQYETTIDEDDIYEVIGETSFYEMSIDIEDSVVEFIPTYPTYDSDIDIHNDYLLSAKATITAALPPSASQFEYMMRVIEPISSLETDIGARNYFDNVDGLVGLEETVYVRYREAALTDRGTWAINTIYRADDFVVDSTDENEYYCVAGAEFISTIVPSFDTARWRKMVYTPTRTMSPRKAVLISGSISLVPTGSSLPAFVGYMPNHYFFTRDYRLGIIRHQWLGCVQTDDTTIDGKPVVEVFTSTGDTLFVKSDGTPVPPPSDPSGPILDVR